MESNNYLPRDYKPSSFDIMCASGAQFFQHPANVTFREIITRYLPSYEAASSKLQKSTLVKNIIREVNSRSPPGTTTQFIRLDKHVGLWFMLNPAAVRQKVGQTLRETKTNLDPQKRNTQAEKRARNYKARQLRRKFKMRRGDSKNSSLLGSSTASLTSESEEDHQEPFPSLIRTQSLPIHQATVSLPQALIRRAQSDGRVVFPTRKPSLTPEEVALATVPPTFSSDWFDIPSLSSKDADLTDSIQSLFDEFDVLVM